MTVSAADPETAPCPEQLSQNVICSQRCHQPQVSKGLGEVALMGATADRPIDHGLCFVP